MELASLGPLVTAQFVWQPRAGTYARTVVAKATFMLRPGIAKLANAQEPIANCDRFWDDDTSRPLRIANDLAPYKSRPEVLLVGHAYSPARRPTRSLMTRLVVGEMDKRIEVWCNRSLRIADGHIVEGKPFARMALTWEMASGVPGSVNPAGKRFQGEADRQGTIALAHLQPPGIVPSQSNVTFAPTCYAPIAADWAPRAQYRGRTTNTLNPERWAENALPEGFDWRFFQVAPVDQQLTQIRPDESLILENLHPQHARLVTQLPGVCPKLALDRASGIREEVPLVADTLWIDPDRGICCVVWRGHFRLARAEETGRITVWADGINQDDFSEFPDAVVDDDAVTVAINKSNTKTIQLQKIAQPVLPFVPATAARPMPPSAPPLGEVKKNRVRRDTLPLPEPGRPELAIPSTKRETKTNEVKTYPTPITSSSTPPVAPPPLIGPLAHLKTAAVAPAAASPNVPKPVAAASPNVPKPVAAASPDEKPVQKSISLAICAALTASIAWNKADKARLLEKHELRGNEWETVQAHWDEAIKAETKRGQRTLLDQFDKAYIEQLEKERGPITIQDYARLSVASERGTMDQALKELKLPKGAVMRIERQWPRGKDMTMIQAAIAAARKAS